MITWLFRQVMIVMSLCAALSPLGAQSRAADLSQLRVAHDETKKPSERLEILFGILADEIQNPSPSHEPTIHNQHDWVLVNTAGTIGDLAARYGDLQQTLRTRSNKETNEDARKCLYIALGFAGDQSVWKKLKELTHLDARPYLQEHALMATHGAKWVLLVPDLIELLNHPRHHLGPMGTLYPVRRNAFLALTTMGVQTKMLEGDGNYGFDRSSAVRVVASKLASTDESEVRAAIEGIGRIGGDEARTQLTVFVETNQNRPQKTAEVRLARTTLESIKKNQTKKQ